MGISRPVPAHDLWAYARAALTGGTVSAASVGYRLNIFLQSFPRLDYALPVGPTSQGSIMTERDIFTAALAKADAPSETPFSTKLVQATWRCDSELSLC